MKNWKKYLRASAAAAALGFAAVGMTPSTTYASEAGMNYMREVYAANQTVENGNMVQHVKGSCVFGTANADVAGKYLMKPLTIGGTLHADYTSITGNGKAIDIPFYVAQEESKMTLYYQMDGQWKKHTTPLTAEMLKEMEDIKQDANKSMEYIKDVNIVSETEKEKVLSIELDAQKIKKTLVDAANKDQKSLENVKPEEREKVREGMLNFVNALGDGFEGFTYTENVNKDTKLITASSINLSTLVQKTASSLLASYGDKMKPEEKNLVTGIISSVQITIDGEYTDYGTVGKVEVPADVKASAVEVKLEAPKTEKK